MGERSWARLTIGGTVSRAALAGALKRLEGLRLESCLGDDHVVVEDPEASWGGFSELEAWLQARRVPFDLESAACLGAWPDMLVHFRPGRGRVEFVSDDSHAEPIIPRSALRTALSRCRTLRGLGAWLARTYRRSRPSHRSGGRALRRQRTNRWMRVADPACIPSASRRGHDHANSE